MKINASERFLFLVLVTGAFVASSLIVQGDDSSPSNTRYKVLSTAAGQFAETYMLDTQNGRVWQMRGQVSKGPYLMSCVYQLSDGHTALSGLFGVPASTPRNDRFIIKSASSGQHTETYILDKQSGRLWQMRGQVSKGPYLMSCVYQLADGHTSPSPADAVSTSASTNDRFSITCVSGGQYSETYVSDTQVGYVWKLQGQVSQGPYLIACVYQLLNGDNSKSPMDGDAEIELAKKSSQSEKPQDAQGAYGDTSQETPANLSPAVQKKLDEHSRKFEEDMKKLFPNEQQPK